ncbi:hypothetical protein XU18_3523 [Perkinsela sp. CCAP 1560/4]|nr:hypothetical protein XU18_3523 [Perkinsela sp. CCAP 1560/4]|eukprot:KNH05552.1 hypothetical protein XU18_3523 [Perkinsela sp. CCAP 1560/4]
MTPHQDSLPEAVDAFQDMYHFPSTSRLPLMITDPAILKSVKYRRRTNAPKSSIHWGQRKLLLSEIQFLSLYANPKHVRACVSQDTTPPMTHADPCCLVVYAGSAPGTHLTAMPLVFPLYFSNFHFELHDPRQFDQSLYAWEKSCAGSTDAPARGGISIYNHYFDDSVAIDVLRRRMGKRKGLQFLFECLFQDEATEATSILGADHCALKTLFYAASEDTPLLFISDIRTGSLVTEDDFDAHDKNEQFEDEVKQNMEDQLRWHQIMQPKHSMLKFRLPYVDDEADTQAEEKQLTTYLSGDIILPLWTRPTSSECRIVTRSTGEADVSHTSTFPPVSLSHYANSEYQDQLFFFNSVVRETFHFNHFYNLAALNGQRHAVKKQRKSQVRNLDLDHRYDASMELEVLVAALTLEKLAQRGYGIPNLLGEEKHRWIMREGICAVSGDSPHHEIYNEALLLSQNITHQIGRSFDGAIRAREGIILEKARSFSWTPTALALIKAQREDREKPQWWKNVEEV